MEALGAFLFVLLLLVLVHEIGHALMARLSGCPVEEFGFGLPPRLFARRVGSTTFSVNALPIGGFVRLFGESDADASDPRAFTRLAPSRRAMILSAGIAANLLLAVAAFALAAGIGIDVPLRAGEGGSGARRVEIIEVRETPTLRAADIRPGDALAAVDGQRFGDAATAAKRVREFSGSELQLTLRRGSAERVIALRFSPPKRVGEVVGLGLLDVGTVRAPWYKAPVEGVRMTARTVVVTWSGLSDLVRQLVHEGKIPDGVAGPVGIAAVTGAVAQRGFPSLLELIGVLSVNLALVNAFPIPALDGGRLLFLLIESLGIRSFRGRPERLAHAVGFLFLILVLGLITLEDIRRLSTPPL